MRYFMEKYNKISSKMYKQIVQQKCKKSATQSGTKSGQ